MDDWPPFVIEAPPDAPDVDRGWKRVVFELEDSLVEPEREPTVLIREKA
jgi:hypothetical protein